MKKNRIYEQRFNHVKIFDVLEIYIEEKETVVSPDQIKRL